MHFRKTQAEISLKVLKNNFEQIINVAGRSRFICPMIKANAYGHGAVQTAMVLQEVCKTPLGVSLIEEGIELRLGGINSDIIVYGIGEFNLNSFQTLTKYNLTAVINNKFQIDQILKHNFSSLNVHIEFNTGMNRLGFVLDDIEYLIDFFKKNKLIHLKGVFTHMHSSFLLDVEGSSAQQQVHDFESIEAAFSQLNCIFHFFNSDGIILFSQKNKKTIYQQKTWGFRPGILLYGYHEESLTHHLNIQPVMKLRSTLQSLQLVKKGDSVSYGATWIAQRNSIIGVVPIGYADGIHRILSNHGFVSIASQTVPIVGRICMDFLMVDLTDFVGDHLVDQEVLFFGDRSIDQRCSVQFIAKLSDTISYEVLTSVSSRVHRVYKND